MSEKKSFFGSLPGLLTGIAAIIGVGITLFQVALPLFDCKANLEIKATEYHKKQSSDNLTADHCGGAVVSN